MTTTDARRRIGREERSRRNRRQGRGVGEGNIHTYAYIEKDEEELMLRVEKGQVGRLSAKKEEEEEEEEEEERCGEGYRRRRMCDWRVTRETSVCVCIIPSRS